MSKPLPRLHQGPLLSYSAQEIIKEYILENHLRPGDALPPETELGRQLGISRNSVREAVKGLVALGIIEVRRGSGLFVSQFSFEPLLENISYGVRFELKELSDLLEVRRVLEVGLIEKAMAAARPEQIERLREVLREMESRVTRGENFLEADRLFHRILFENLDNTILLTLLDTFWVTFRKATAQTAIEDIDPLRTYRDHAAIVDAVEAGDVTQARATLEQHYAGIVERLARARGAG